MPGTAPNKPYLHGSLCCYIESWSWMNVFSWQVKVIKSQSVKVVCNEWSSVAGFHAVTPCCSLHCYESWMKWQTLMLREPANHRAAVPASSQSKADWQGALLCHQSISAAVTPYLFIARAHQHTLPWPYYPLIHYKPSIYSKPPSNISLKTPKVAQFQCRSYYPAGGKT